MRKIKTSPNLKLRPVVAVTASALILAGALTPLSPAMAVDPSVAVGVSAVSVVAVPMSLMALSVTDEPLTASAFGLMAPLMIVASVTESVVETGETVLNVSFKTAGGEQLVGQVPANHPNAAALQPGARFDVEEGETAYGLMQDGELMFMVHKPGAENLIRDEKISG